MPSLFIFASLATHLPQRDDIAKDAQADEPDLGPGRAKSNIIGYIYGVTPGLAIWIVFGLTKEFRQIMYKRLVPRRWQRQDPEPTPLLQSPWSPSASTPSNSHVSRLTLPPITADVELQLDDFNWILKRRATPDVFVAAPLLANTRTRSFQSAGTGRESM